MRVLLINPPPYQRVDAYDTPNFTRHGLACLAAKLRADGLGEVEIVDGKFERLSYEEIQERVRRFAPDIVGLTAFTNEIKPAAQVALTVKALSPSIITVSRVQMCGGQTVVGVPASVAASALVAERSRGPQSR